MKSYELTPGAIRPVIYAPKDANGNDVAVESVEFISDDPSIAEFSGFVPDAGSISLAGVAVGETDVRMRADADLGDGVQTIEEVIHVVVGFKATVLGFDLGAEIPPVA